MKTISEKLLNRKELDKAYSQDHRRYRDHCRFDWCLAVLMVSCMLLTACIVGLVWNYLS